MLKMWKQLENIQIPLTASYCGKHTYQEQQQQH